MFGLAFIECASCAVDVSPLLDALKYIHWLLLLLFMLKDIKMRLVIQMGIAYLTSGPLKSGQMQQFLVQEKPRAKASQFPASFAKRLPRVNLQHQKQEKENSLHHILIIDFQ